MLFVKCKDSFDTEVLISMREVTKIYRARTLGERDTIETKKGERFGVDTDGGVFENAVINLEWEAE